MKNIAKVAALTLALTSSAHTTSAETVTKNEPPCLTAGLSNELNSILNSDEKIEYKKKYVIGNNVNIRKQPTTDSEIIGHVGFNDKILVTTLGGSWYCVKLDDGIGYISKKYVSNKRMDYVEFSVPYAEKKTWMPYADANDKSIFSISSKQFKLQELATTGKYGIRTVNGRYCVALGSYFGCEIGQYFDLVLANGTVIECIMGDQKADKHTDSANIITTDTNCLSEFIVSKSSLNKDAKRDGDMSSCCKEWEAHVVKIRVYDKVVIV